MEEKQSNTEKVVKKKRHFDPAKGAVRLIALLLALLMMLATCGTLLFYLLNM